jgi:hypothetical protein
MSISKRPLWRPQQSSIDLKKKKKKPGTPPPPPSIFFFFLKKTNNSPPLFISHIMNSVRKINSYKLQRTPINTCFYALTFFFLYLYNRLTSHKLDQFLVKD